MAIYINNFFIVKNFINNIKILKIIFNNQFKISDFGTYYFYLGMEIIRDRLWRVLKFSQIVYLEKVFQDYGIKNYNNVNTLMETSS